MPAEPGLTTNGLAGTYAFTATYDNANHPTSIGHPAAGGLAAETVTTSNLPTGYATTLTGTQTYVSNSLYDNNGRISSRTLGTGTNSLERGYSWDDATNRLTGLDATVNGQLVQNDNYTYDTAGNVTAIVHD
ncbi:MAG: hypothetical protein WBP59_07385, partial [Ilumatobacteraceae bacterium]